MNLRQMEIFKAVMETGTVTGAAERLMVSQPAVTKQLRRFEQELRFPIFERVSGRLVPTAEARALYDQVERVYAGVDQIARFAEDLREARRGRLVVAALPILSNRWLPGLLSRFLAERPDVAASIATRRSMEVLEWVAAHQVDLGIAMMGADRPGVVQEHLMQLEIVCAVPRGHRLAEHEVVEASDLHEESCIWLSSFDRSPTVIDRFVEDAHVLPKSRVEVFMASMACTFVEEGIGVALVDVLTAHENASERVVVRPLRPRVAFDITLLRPAHAPRSKLTDAFVAELKRHAAESGAGQPARELFA